ncbi:Nucleoside-diphosphate-sugar epimerase [Quadrisphaera granulorum]|uniref:Nucleoside-diphosphate-sugar epimerase n=1 Tax=Quadrisphaera granulorum TaxID=317664 RepID=A0A316AB98_9ACTN|nr:NAD-dependent epimerase/dehydratase family protein [Quadrisphaera granulorum]PWJ54852.1 nucleoside-diphosphate-sugar epimerase [Quadrisphaera granulorum]SZE95798.1 Nucleoside-diphosphate-sugar epimerase [Quadrisphaera granulorum]
MADLADGGTAVLPLDGHVVVTGAGSPAGRAVAQWLAAAGVEVVALEDAPAAPTASATARSDSATAGKETAQETDQDDGDAPDAGAAWHHVDIVRVDLTSPDVLAAMVSGSRFGSGAPGGRAPGGGAPAAVVHVALDSDLRAALAQTPARRRERAEASVRAVVTAAAAAGAQQLVLVSSAMVHGALPDAPVPLPDDAPLLAAPDDGLVGDLLAVEEVWAHAAQALPGVRTAVLRPAAVVGSDVDTVVTRSFEVPRLLALRERAPVWQFCHVDDLAAAVAVVLREGLTGAMGAGADGVLVHEALEKSSGLRSVELPARLAQATAERLARLGLLPTPAGDLAYVVHPWAVSSARLRAAGWEPQHTNEDCLAVLLADVQARRAFRRSPTGRLGREAALGAAGAAGAAVAVVATAAVLRQARARRGR